MSDQNLQELRDQVEQTNNSDPSVPDPRSPLKPCRGPIPRSLKILAWLFIATGVLAIFQILFFLLLGHISVNLNVLGLFIGMGLLNLRKGWRTCGLVYIWFNLIAIPILIVLFLFRGEPLDLMIVNRKAGEIPLSTAVLLGLMIFAVFLWAYYVLTRADVRKLFKIN